MPSDRSLQWLHVLDLTETSIKTATEELTPWFLWLPRDASVTWIDAPRRGALARARVPDWLLERHVRMILQTWGTA